MSELVNVPLKEYVLDMRVREWCKLPYPNHPKGCPNYGKKEGCPPQALLCPKIIMPPFRLVAVSFNLAEWAKRMKEKHPNWSDRQARCCLYWQGKIRKRLRQECERLVSNGDVVLYNPEATGVNVFLTCESIGLKLERNPQNVVWKVAIIGKKKT